MSDGALAIFVKTPGHSAVKTRLAETCGERYATEWHERSAQAVASIAREASAQCGVAAYWAVAESSSRAMDAWAGLPIIAQGNGELGERMARVHTQLVARHGFGMLIGADAPQVTAQLLCEAAGWLCAPSPRAVIGPAVDGGFWLFGSNRLPPHAQWTCVPYSSHETARSLRETMQELGVWKVLDELCDVDRGVDLAIVANALRELAAPTREQRALVDWMDEQDAAGP